MGARNATGAKRVKAPSAGSATKGVFQKLNKMLFGKVNDKAKAAGSAAATGLMNMHKKR